MNALHVLVVLDHVHGTGKETACKPQAISTRNGAEASVCSGAGRPAGRTTSQSQENLHASLVCGDVSASSQFRPLLRVKARFTLPQVYSAD